MSPSFQTRVVEEVRAGMTRWQSPWVDYEGAAAYTAYSVDTVLRWVKKGFLPEYFAPGSDRPRFLKSDLDAVMRSGSRKKK